MFLDEGNFHANIATFQNADGQNQSVFLLRDDFGEVQQFCHSLVCYLRLNS